MKKHAFLLLFFVQNIGAAPNNGTEKASKSTDLQNQNKSHACSNYAKASALTTAAVRIRTARTLKTLHAVNRRKATTQTLTHVNRLKSSSNKVNIFQRLLFGAGNKAHIPLATATSQKSFVIPATTASTTLATQIIVPLGILAIYWATTYGTEKTRNLYLERKQKKQNEFVPITIFDHAKAYEEVVRELNDGKPFDNDEEEESWWERNEHKFPLWSATGFAAYNVGQIAKNKYNQPTAFEQLIDYFQDPENNDFGENAFESFKFDNNQKHEKTISFMKDSKWNFKAKYKEKQASPALLILQQKSKIPEENNVLHNALQFLKNHNNNAKNMEVNTHLQVSIHTQKHGTYFAFIPPQNSHKPIECYHEQAFKENLNNIQHRKIHVSHDSLIPLSFEELI